MHGHFVRAVHIFYFPGFVNSMSRYPCSSLRSVEDIFGRAAGVFLRIAWPSELRRFERGSSFGKVIRQSHSMSGTCVFSGYYVCYLLYHVTTKYLSDNKHDAHRSRNRNTRFN
jgi:hypothetical protein